MNKKGVVSNIDTRISDNNTPRFLKKEPNFAANRFVK